MGSIIMDGAIVNSFSMVAAGALVTPGKGAKENYGLGHLQKK